MTDPSTGATGERTPREIAASLNIAFFQVDEVEAAIRAERKLREAAESRLRVCEDALREIAETCEDNPCQPCEMAAGVARRALAGEESE